MGYAAVLGTVAQKVEGTNQSAMQKISYFFTAILARHRHFLWVAKAPQFID
jgi:hypothetical protein